MSANAAGVLVVDDNDMTRDALGAMLDYRGFTVATAKNGREALDLLAAGADPFVILLDVLMPEMDGLEFLDQLAALHRYDHIGVVVVTAREHPPSHPRARFSFRKPISADVLFAAVEACRELAARAT